ncbi:MAG TPA: hypothetical protein VHK88_13945 [Aquihabitans sp.]|jgi:hypothetical protein|nr:hypothetical protein [Aquihabitans sp.]
MLIIFGFRIRFRTTGTISFFCPRCGGDRVGDRRSARRWFTVFWIPVLPLNQVGELVECTTCHTRYEPHVADQPTTADLSQILGNAVRVLTAMVVRTGDAGDAPMAATAVTHVREALPGYDDATLASDVAAVDPALAEQYVAPLAEGLQITGRERLLGDLVRVALAGGTITPDQRRVIDLAGRGLALTPAHVTGIVTSVVAARSPEPHPPVEPPADGT